MCDSLEEAKGLAWGHDRHKGECRVGLLEKLYEWAAVTEYLVLKVVLVRWCGVPGVRLTRCE